MPRVGFGAAAAAVLVVAVACGSSGGNEASACEPGSERCACAADSACDSGLTCYSNRCVDAAALASAGGSDSGGGAGSSSGGVTVAGGGSSGGSTAAAGGSGAGSLGLGAACSSDAECEAGMRCLQSVINGERGYCTHSCSTAQDCVDLQRAIATVVLAPNTAAANHWNARSLYRVVACGDPSTAAYAPIGAADGKKWCATFCPENAAAVYSPDGTLVTACGCWPNFRKDPAKPGLVCGWDPDIECSIFSPCTKTNTQVAECSVGDFSCVVNDRLEGACWDRVTGDQIEQCVAKCRWNCDPACLASSCSPGAEDACTRACCNSNDPACQ